MTIPRLTRAGFLALSVLVATSCAHRGSDMVLGPAPADEDSLCTVKVKSAYDRPIEAGVRAGAAQLELGTLQPEGEVAVDVPCTFDAVTVFRVVRNGGGAADAWIGPRSRALDPLRVTSFTLRPSVRRGPAGPRR